MPAIRIVTRKSPLALAQTDLVARALHSAFAADIEILPLVTTGDRQQQWSLENKGGKGLFTKELEDALLENRADVAVHSAKDLPGEQPAGLVVAGYLPRADPRDVLVIREGLEAPETIATSSPRRRCQLGMLYPNAEFCEVRGNVHTRLRKIAEERQADATVLAAAGLARLKIGDYPGLEFRPLGFAQMVPAVGQAAIALQCKPEFTDKMQMICDGQTEIALGVERAIQSALGGGCQSAIGVHASGDTLWMFHEQVGLRSLPLTKCDLESPDMTARNILHNWGLV